MCENDMLFSKKLRQYTKQGSGSR